MAETTTTTSFSSSFVLATRRATFLIFSDYARPPIRLAALMGLHVIYVFTHDSIALGQDGPTHQPIEQLANLRAIPNLTLIRPADANEVSVAWKVAVEIKNQPVVLVFSRQSVPTYDRSEVSSAEGLRKGAYVLLGPADNRMPDVILIASGSEVSLAVEAREKLLNQDIHARVVSMPSWELFKAQPKEYQQSILPLAVKARIAIEAGTAQGWREFVGDQGEIISLEHFGASAPGPVLMTKFGFTVGNIISKVMTLVNMKEVL